MKTIPTPPKPWAVPNPKAFVLGCDPTAFYKDAQGTRSLILFNTVFDLGGSDLRYFAAIHNNLLELDLDYTLNLYVQNLITDYQTEETSKNKQWNLFAKESIPDRRAEFDKIDPDVKLPVFLTSERLYKVLMNPGEKLLSASALYQSENVVIPAEKNLLGRPLIALYRHPSYNYNKQPEYFKRVKNVLNTF
jgi:hypothetical protein